MWDLIKSGSLWISRPSRVMISARKKEVRKYQSEPVLLVEIAKEFDQETQASIEAALAFSQAALSIRVLANSERKDLTLQDYLKKNVSERPYAYLFIGKTPDKEEAAALKLLDIPYRSVLNPEPMRAEDLFPTDIPERALWREAFEHRPMIYAHFERVEAIEKLLEAYRVARRNYPELLLVMSGLSMHDIPYESLGLMVMNETKNKNHLKYADIMVMQSRVYQPLMSSLARVQVLTQMRNLRPIATEALKSAASLVLYDVRPQSLGNLSEFANAGLIWNVRRKESLGAALSQALNLEESATLTSQSVMRICTSDNNLLNAIDELIGLERAA